MATRVNDGRLTKIIYLLHPQNLLLDAIISEISRTLCRVIAHFVPNFVPIAMRVSRVKFDCQHSMAHPQKPPIGAKISHTSRTQTEL